MNDFRVKPHRIKSVKIYYDKEGYIDIELVDTYNNPIRVMEEPGVIETLRDLGVIQIFLPQMDGRMRKRKR